MNLQGNYIGTTTSTNTYIRGWWEHKNGAEGGELVLQLDEGNWELVDYDGCYALPVHVKQELLDNNVIIDIEC